MTEEEYEDLEYGNGYIDDERDTREQPIIQKCPRCGFEYFDIKNNICSHCGLNL